MMVGRRSDASFCAPKQELRVRYTVWSHGREIGQTDLGFRRCFKGFRSGWFHPNLAGEELMPIIDAVASAIFGCMHRESRDHPGRPIAHAEPVSSEAFNDAAEALARAESLDLQLRREDGTLVPTSSIGLRGYPHDVELEDLEATDWSPGDEGLDGTESFESSAAGEGCGELDDAGTFWESTSWRPDEAAELDESSGWRRPRLADDQSALQGRRYQIHVLIDCDDVIP